MHIFLLGVYSAMYPLSLLYSLLKQRINSIFGDIIVPGWTLHAA